VVSAAAYARFKQIQGSSNCFPARAGKISPQTEYILNRFHIPIPEYLPDLVPKAGYYLCETPVTINENASLWDALDQLQNDNFKALPIVDTNGVYQSILHYKGFAQYIINNINPQKKSAFPISLNHLIKTIHAQSITLFKGDEVIKSPIVVAASYTEGFQKHLEAEGPDNALVIVGDRWDIQKYCIERKIRALILSNGNTLSRELAALAEQNGVTVMISPFDTSSTAMLIIYSTPVGTLGDTSVPFIHLNDPVRKIQEPLSHSPSRCLAVGDDDGKVAGVLSEGDLIKDPNIEIIMVDHNEPGQAIEGIENYKILEVIDHHRLGNLSTRYPITFINRVVGATCTIITNLYREQRIPLEKNIASILLCGILSDTLSLQSATTSETDRETADYLSSITGLDVKTLGNELQSEANKVNSRPALELVTLDMKEYTEQGKSFSVSQIETDTPQAMVKRSGEIFSALEKTYASKEYLFSALLVTDVTRLDSLLFISGKKSFTMHINFPEIDGGIYMLKDVVSRKKQLMPLLAELVEKAVG
jgi:manganese-dependent inorganic pyrophosphatase